MPKKALRQERSDSVLHSSHIAFDAQNFGVKGTDK